MADENYYLEIPKYNLKFKDTTKEQEKQDNPTITFDNIPSSSISAIYIADKSNLNAYSATSSIGINQRKYINALRNTIEWYSSVSPSHIYNNFTASEVAIINIPSLFYGKSIKKGSVRLDFHYTGSVIASLQDSRQNGELIETTGSNTGSCAGIVLYDEGLILLTGSWNLDSAQQDNYIYYVDTETNEVINSSDYPKWIYWGKALEVNLTSSTFEIDFEGVDEINTITMFAHAAKGEFNTSNNRTFIDLSTLSYKDDKVDIAKNGKSFIQNPYVPIKNTTSSPYEDVSGSVQKQTFISSIGIFDKDQKLIAIAKLSQPIKKTNARDYTFKLKLDL